MRKICLLLLLIAYTCNAGYGQIFYLQTFTGASFPVGWGPSGSRVVLSNQAPSDTYTIPPFSAGNNVRFDHCAPTGETVSLLVNGVINTSGKSNIRVGFGRRISTAWNREMAFEWSSDGTNWNLISNDVRPGTTDSWSYVFFDLPSSADNVSNLRFRFSFITATNANCTAPPNFRIDDFAVGQNFSLPVELSRFTAQLINKQVLANWATKTETNNAYFAVEHSTNGTDFVELDQLAGAGTTRERQEYSFWHKNPDPGINYYRLRQVDINDNIVYSPVRTVNFDQGIPLHIFPSPANDFIRVQWGQALMTEAGAWEIYDARGVQLVSGKISDPIMELEIPLKLLSPGLCLLKVNLGGKTVVQTFVKS